jgi:hypothetical protein
VSHIPRTVNTFQFRKTLVQNTSVSSDNADANVQIIYEIQENGVVFCGLGSLRLLIISS